MNSALPSNCSPQHSYCTRTDDEVLLPPLPELSIYIHVAQSTSRLLVGEMGSMRVPRSLPEPLQEDGHLQCNCTELLVYITPAYLLSQASFVPWSPQV